MSDWTICHPPQALLEAARVAAARSPGHWNQDSSVISTRLDVPMAQVRHTLLTFVKDWNTDPRRAAQQSLQAVSDLKRRISAVAESAAEQQRTAIAREARRAVPSNQVGAMRNPTR
jgi:hypothetical protein